MWTCPLCSQAFVNTHQTHSCNDRTLDDFLKGRPAGTIAIFDHFIAEYQRMAPIRVHPAKNMIGLALRIRIAYITRLGRDFVEVCFPFSQSYPDNLCFHRIAQVPGTMQFNHYFRMFSKDDLNDEVRRYMQLALDGGR